MKIIPVYLAVGVLMNIIGPLASQIRREMKDLRRKTVPLREVASRRRKLFYSELLFRMLVVLMYPVA